MNPEEGGLRPQLLDRFGLMVTAGQLDAGDRLHLLRTVLDFEEELYRDGPDWLADAEREDLAHRERLDGARRRVLDVEVPDTVLELCAEAAARTDAVGQRGEIVATLAARAYAALAGADRVEPAHLLRVLPLALRHRRPETAHGGTFDWGAEDQGRIEDLFPGG